MKLKLYLIIIAGILILGIAYLLIQVSIGKNDPRNLALSLSEIQKNIPSRYILNPSLSLSEYKVGNFWTNETEKEEALNNGFINGYYESYVYQEQAASNIKTVGSSISIFNNQTTGNYMQTSINSFIQTYLNNCTQFSFPTIGDSSFGCNETADLVNKPTSYVNSPTSYSVIIFYKNNVIVRVWIGQSGIIDLRNETVQYANIIANRI
jgi:type II secretory pathway pseudopilin PulG